MGLGGKRFLAEKNCVEDCISRSFIMEEPVRAGMRRGEGVEPGATGQDKLNETASQLSFRQRTGRLVLHLKRVTKGGMWGIDRAVSGKGSVVAIQGKMAESPPPSPVAGSRKYLSSLLASSASCMCNAGKNARGSPISGGWCSWGDFFLALSVWHCICMDVFLRSC